jgi:hypothetical protein
MRRPRAEFATYAAAEPTDDFEHGFRVECRTPLSVDLWDEEIHGCCAPLVVFFGLGFILDGYDG